ncbi:hypothetical protein GY45DRAFT_306253 [Cubamyces sp. BRFM 1775]|nr:hypothetical protein GY45DRAFT_306253 [Cubamyces sp. BRFM 1775]
MQLGYRQFSPMRKVFGALSRATAQDQAFVCYAIAVFQSTKRTVRTYKRVLRGDISAAHLTLKPAIPTSRQQRQPKWKTTIRHSSDRFSGYEPLNPSVSACAPKGRAFGEPPSASMFMVECVDVHCRARQCSLSNASTFMAECVDVQIMNRRISFNLCPAHISLTSRISRNITALYPRPSPLLPTSRSQTHGELFLRDVFPEL